MSKLVARAVLLEQFQDEMNVQKAMDRVISELGPEVINQKEAVEWYAKFTTGDTDISEESCENDRFILRNGTFLKWARANIAQSNSFAIRREVNGIDGRSLLVSSCLSRKYILVDPLYGIEKHIKIDWSNIPLVDRRITRLSPFQFLSDNLVFGTMRIESSNEVALFCDTLDLTTCTLKFHNLLKFALKSFYYTIKNKTTNQIIVVFVPNSAAPTRISIVNIRNGELTIESTIKGPSRLITATLRDDKLLGFQGYDTRKLVEFSLTDQTTRIHKIQTGEQLKKIKFKLHKHLWIGDVLLLAKTFSGIRNKIYIFDLVGLEWKRTNYDVNGYIRDMSTNDGNQLNVHIWKTDAQLSFHQFQFNATESLAILIWKAVCRYSHGNQQFFQWFQSKQSQCSKFRSIW